jgi:hypothetical protein
MFSCVVVTQVFALQAERVFLHAQPSLSVQDMFLEVALHAPM